MTYAVIGDLELLLEPENRDKSTALALISSVPPLQRQDLADWASELLAIRESGAPAISKANRAMKATLRRVTLLPFLRAAAEQIKRLVWDNRSWAMRGAIAGSGGALLYFGSGAAAGIVALGGGIGIPLWIVFGAGASFAATIVSEVAAGIAQSDVAKRLKGSSVTKVHTTEPQARIEANSPSRDA